MRAGPPGWGFVTGLAVLMLTWAMLGSLWNEPVEVPSEPCGPCDSKSGSQNQLQWGELPNQRVGSGSRRQIPSKGS